MPVSRISPFLQEQITASATGDVTTLLTGWMPGFGASSLRIMDEIQGLSGSYRQKVQWRTADVSTDYPNAWNLSSTYRTANGVTVEDFSPTAGKMWIQAGIASSVTTSSTVGEALASLRASTNSNGSIVAAGAVNINPDLNTSQSAYFPIGEVFPALGANNFLFAFIVSGVSGTLTFQPALRGMDTEEEPSAWTDQGSAHNSTANERWSSGTITPTPVTKLLAQAGVKVTSTGARGMIHVLVAIST
jgi:hypothetical protein